MVTPFLNYTTSVVFSIIMSALVIFFKPPLPHKCVKKNNTVDYATLSMSLLA